MSTHHDRWLTRQLLEGRQRMAAVRDEAARLARLGPVKRPQPRSDVQADYDEHAEECGCSVGDLNNVGIDRTT